MTGPILLVVIGLALVVLGAHALTRSTRRPK